MQERQGQRSHSRGYLQLVDGGRQVAEPSGQPGCRASEPWPQKRARVAVSP